MPDLHERFRKNARAWRLRLGMTQAQVAEKMQVSGAYVAELEKGRHCPSLAVVERYANALEVDPQILLALDENLAKAS